MPFSIRPFRRFPVRCPVTYHADLFEGQGIVWNLSVNGWRLFGNVPLRPAEPLSLTVSLPNQQRIKIRETVVR
ncbi:MAG: PilZ domain-containing protein [Nitrospiraceae bacterium]